MKTKRIISLITAIMLLCLASVSAFAQPAPKWVDISSATPILSISGTRANCGVSVLGHPGTESIEADIRLLDEDGNEVKSWSASSANSILKNSKTVTVKKGVAYTLEADITVYRNGGSESAYIYKDATA